MFKKLTFIISLVLVVVLAVLFYVFIVKKTFSTNEIKSVSLVYRYTNHAWGDFDYSYLINSDGNIYYFDYIKDNQNNKKSDYLDSDSKEFLDDLIKGEDSENFDTKYTSSIFSEDLNKQLKSINYDNINLKYKDEAKDAGTYSYYCLVEYEFETKLVKIKEAGDRISTNNNREIKEICEYIDIVMLQINSK